jgi:hypothetical protein
MKNIKTLIITATIIILMGLACAVNTEAATVRYAKSVSEIVPEGEYILEAAEYPLSQTKKVDGWVATPDANGWMNLKKYNASTAESKHQIWRISNFVWNSYPDGGGYYGDHASTYTIDNSDPLPYWSNDFMARAVTYTSKGFYRQEEIYGAFSTHYEHFNSPAQRFTIKKVRVDAKTGRTVFKFINVKSGKAMAAGGYALFYVRVVE